MKPRPLGPAYRRLFGASAISNLGDGISKVAWPWLASALTRNGLLIAAVTFSQTLPWVLVSLPAGVLADRHDRRRLMLVSNVARTVLTLTVAGVVWREAAGLPTPAQVTEIGGASSTRWLLYGVLLVATLLLGTAEVVYDNSAQTIMPSLVHRDDLEKANGRLWSVEQAMNDFAGLALGAALLAVAFPVPFFIDGLTFGLSAALIWGLPRQATNARPRAAMTGDSASQDQRMRTEIAEGFRWLRTHPLLRPLAITLGLVNGFGIFGMAILVLFAQEVLGTTPLQLALLLTGSAAGALAGGWTGPWLSRAIGPGRCLQLTLATGGVTSILIGLSSHWVQVWALFAISMAFAVLWNVITVSLRQTIIPDHLLGRVNSVYRFIGTGSMSIGALIGGLLLAAGETLSDRTFGLRLPWLVSGVLQLLLVSYALRHLTTERIEAARAAVE